MFLWAKPNFNKYRKVSVTLIRFELTLIKIT